MRNQETMTKAEGLLWNTALKGNKTGYRFLRQKLIGNYILDFYCAKLKLLHRSGGSKSGPKMRRRGSKD